MITTRADVKTILKFDTTANDEIINMLLPMVQDDILCFLKNKFKTEITQTAETISFSGNSILDSASGFVTSGFVPGNIIVQDSKINDGFYTVTETASGTLTTLETLIAESAENEIRITQVKFPKALELTVANMIGYALNNKHGVKSESISRYSVSYANDTQSLINGYPDSITRGLLKWRRVYNDY